MSTPQSTRLTSTPNSWLASLSHNALVSIGTHSLHLQCSGPARKRGDPVAIIIQGLTATASSWAAVSRILSPHIRTYTYSRSGYYPSESSPLPPTSENIALELDLLLQAAGIESPFVVIAHSWGGILAREFIARRTRGEIAGVVFVEANQERTLEVLDWRPFFSWCGDADVDPIKIWDLEEKRQLKKEEWEALQRDISDVSNRKQGEREVAEYEMSFEVLRNKGQLSAKTPLLGNSPVSVIKGQNGRWLKKLFDVVVEKGYGREEDRQKFEEFLRTFDEKDFELQSELRKLSSNTRFVEGRNSGHDVQLTEPDFIVEEVRWILSQYVKEN